MSKKPIWTLDTIKITLSNDKGEEKVLNSGDLTDFTCNEIIDDCTTIIENEGGELAWHGK